MIEHILQKPQLIIFIAIIFVILIVATIVQEILTRKYSNKDFSELRQRIRSWWIMASVFSIAILLNKVISIIFMGLVSFLALKEYFSIVPTRRADRRVLFFAYLAIPVQFYWIHIGWYGMFIIFIPVYMFLFLPMVMALIGETQGFLGATSSLHWGLMTTVFSLSHMAFLLVLPNVKNPAAGSAGLVLFLVFLTQFNDVSQYLFGKLLGKHKVIPKVSPNKTWEGTIGGIFTTICLSYFMAPLLTQFTPVSSLITGIIIGLGGFIGDVSISAIKRDMQIKDSGTLLPGHGGILDRIDSLTYTAPLFFHYVHYFYY